METGARRRRELHQKIEKIQLLHKEMMRVIKLLLSLNWPMLSLNKKLPRIQQRPQIKATKRDHLV